MIPQSYNLAPAPPCIRKCDGLAIIWACLLLVPSALCAHFPTLQDRLPFLPFLLNLLQPAGLLAIYAAGHLASALPVTKLLDLCDAPFSSRLKAILVFAPALLLFVSLINFLMQRISPWPIEAQPTVSLALKTRGLSDTLWLILHVAVLAPISEEFLFRLALPRFLTAAGWQFQNAFILSSFLFATAHRLWWGFPSLFLFALALCWLRKRQDFLTAALVHATYNLLLIGALTFLAMYE